MPASMHQSGVSDPEQEWINKYRTAIANSEPVKKPSFQKMVRRVGYLVGITIGKSQKALTKAVWFAKISRPERLRTQPHGETAVESTKKKRGPRKQNRGKSAA